MIGSLLGFSLLGLSTLGLANYMGSFEKVKVSYSQQSNVIFLHTEILEAMRSSLVSVGTEIDSSDKATNTGIKKFGLCSIVKKAENLTYTKIKNSVICPVKIEERKVMDATLDAYTEERWKYFLQESGNWAVKDDAVCNEDRTKHDFKGSFDGDFKACLKHNNLDGVYARAIMEPQKLPKFEGITSGSSKLPVDYLVYELKTFVSILKSELDGEPPSESKQYMLTKGDKLVWASEVLECHVCKTNQNKNCKLVRVSSLGLTPSLPESNGTETDKGICYHSFVSVPEMQDALSVGYVSKNISQGFKHVWTEGVGSYGGYSLGRLSSRKYGRAITLDRTKQSAISCKQNLYRCSNIQSPEGTRDPELFDPKFFDPFLSLTFSLNLDQPSDSHINSMDLSITDGTTIFNPGHIFVGADQETRVGRGVDSNGVVQAPKTYGDKDEWLLRGGGNEFQTLISSNTFKVTGSTTTNMCETICEAPVDSYYPKLEVKYNDLPDAFTSSGQAGDPLFEDAKVSCTFCGAKTCHGYGANLRYKYGKNLRKPSEPVDGLVPECVINDELPRTSVGFDQTVVADIGDQSKRCIIKEKEGKLKAVSCTPIEIIKEYKRGTNEAACFFRGGTLVMYSKHDGTNARRSCEQSVEETQRASVVGEDGVIRSGILADLANAYSITPKDNDANNRNDVASILDEAGLKLQKDDIGEFYSIKNLANMAMFLGSHKHAHGDKVWINYQRDAAGMFHSGWHRVQVEGNDWAFFHREPFQTIAYHDAQTVAAKPGENPKCASCSSPVSEAKQAEFLRRSRPSRPIYIRLQDGPSTLPETPPTNVYTMDHGRSRTETDFEDTTAGNQALLLYHNIKYKGLRLVSDSTLNSYPYLCRNIRAKTYKEAFVVTRATGNSWADGAAKCRDLNTGTGWGDRQYVFTPPSSIEEWSAALQAVAPNAPRYPFPNPFKFVDGIPFYYDVGKHPTDPAQNSKYIRWELSYNYADMPANDYNISEATDNNIVFKETSLASPAAAWVGVEPVDSSKKSKPSESWTWKTAGIFPVDSLFRPDTDITSAGSLKNFSKLDDIKDLESNIGALDKKGKFMKLTDLRNNTNLSAIGYRVVKLCKVKSDKLEFHNALIARGKHDNWPEDDKCSSTSKGKTTKLTRSIYFGLPDGLDSDDLEKLDGASLTKAREGIKSVPVLLLYGSESDPDNKGVHVQNAAKFCKVWRREKYRRALGRCLIKKWNSQREFFSRDGKTHSLKILRDSRKSASVCHAEGEACGGAASYYREVYDKAVADLNNFNNAKYFTTIDNKIAALITQGDDTCGGSRRLTDEITSHNTVIAHLRSEKTRLQNKLTKLKERKDDLQAVVATDLKAACMSAITDENEHEQSFKPSGMRHEKPHDTYVYNFNRSPNSKCWGIHRLQPEAWYNSNVPDDDSDSTAVAGTIGLLGDSEVDTSFTKDAPSCYGDESKSGDISDDCNGYYRELVDIGDDELCDDDIGTVSCDGDEARGTPDSPPVDPKAVIAGQPSNLNDRNPLKSGCKYPCLVYGVCEGTGDNCSPKCASRSQGCWSRMSACREGSRPNCSGQCPSAPEDTSDSGDDANADED